MRKNQITLRVAAASLLVFGCGSLVGGGLGAGSAMTAPEEAGTFSEGPLYVLQAEEAGTCTSTKSPVYTLWLEVDAEGLAQILALMVVLVYACSRVRFL